VPIKIVAIPYHRQVATNYCGPASLQMVVEGLGQPSPQQDQLYTYAHGHGSLDPTTNWASPPDGVDWTLDSVLSGNTYNVLALSSETALTRRIVWSIFNASAPCIALVYGWTHWVTVLGYDVSQDPVSATDSSYTIRALDLHDPWRTVEEGNPPPPPPPRHVTFSEWKRTYLKPVPNGYWVSKVLAVGAFGGPARRKRLADTDERMDTDAIVVSSGLPVIIAPDFAKTRALWGLEAYGLTTREDWKPLLFPALLPRQPLLVQRLDEDSFYYLVPLGPADLNAPATVVVRVDAYSGDYLETNALAKGTQEFQSWGTMAANLETETATRRHIEGRRFTLPEGRGRVLARPETVGVNPSFVWRPCLESLSPSMPFRVITIADRLYYLRLDGELFESLHDAGPGM
jgi:hypothetical protein